jgi:hypothetical protein
MTEQDPRFNSKSSQEGYGTVSAAKAQNKRTGQKGAVVIGLVICALVVAGIAAFVSMSGILDSDSTDDAQRVSLSESRINEGLEAANLATPELSQFAYVTQDQLIGPKFQDITVEEPVNLGTSQNKVIESTVKANAIFKNKGVEITVPVTLAFQYDYANETWVPQTIETGQMTGKPLASASVTAITNNLNEILAAGDATYGETMKDATIVKTNSNLTVDGGTLSIELSKSEEKEDKSVEIRTSTVELLVSWSDTDGWQVTVSNYGEIETTIDYTNSSTTTVEKASQDPEDVGDLNYGDTMTAAGTLVSLDDTKAFSESNNYTNNNASSDADGSIHLALLLTRPIKFNLNGTSYTLAYLPIATQGVDNQLSSLVGMKAEVKGTLEETFATTWAPLGIKATQIEQV